MRLKQLAKRSLNVVAAEIGPHRWRVRRPRLWIIMYHRVLPDSDPRAAKEEPGMIVTPRTLEKQIGWIQNLMPIVRLENWIENVRVGRPVPRNACALTFDDGWRDNYEYAFPVLRRRGASATIFVVPGRIEQAKPFWPNRLAAVLERVSEDSTNPSVLGELEACLPRPLPRAFSAEDRAAVIAAAKRFSDAEIEECLDGVEAVLGIVHEDAELMCWGSLRDGVESELIDVGSHSCSHRRLDHSLTAAEIEHEVRESQRLIAAQIGRAVPLFCYPNGDSTPDVRRVVASCYRAALSTLGGINSVDSDLLMLRRVAVHEHVTSSKSAFLARFSTWM